MDSTLIAIAIGLIALWFERQGFIETVSPMMSAAVLVRLVLILCGLEALS